MRRFDGYNVVITGASRGIGLAILEAFAAEGANIVACSSKCNDNLLSVYHSIELNNSVRIVPIFFDMADEVAVRQAVKDIKAQMPVIDVLVNNAGISSMSLFALTKIEDIHRMFQINYFSPLLLTQQLFGALRKSKFASIINMASVAGLDGGAGALAYGSSKASMVVATKVMAQEFASSGVRVNAVAPGIVDTDMAVKIGDKAVENTVNRSSIKRLARPVEIANAVLFLASPEASFVTGQTIRVDGGI